MRAADADRERVLEVVRQGHADGRLSTPEFYERLEAVYAAKTYAELDHLVADLPSTRTLAASTAPRSPAVPRVDPVGSLTRMPRELRGLWLTWATVVSVNLVVWLIVTLSTGTGTAFWPIWVAGPWGVVNLGITATWWLNRRSGGDPPALPPGSR